MFGPISLEILLLLMLYAAGTAVDAIACIYLLFRRANAFAPDVTPPARLRRWTAAFFAILALGHLWYLPAAVLTSPDAIMLSMLIGGLLDCLTTIPVAIILLFCMLQDRRRPLWPAFAIMAPTVALMLISIVNRNYSMVSMISFYMLFLGFALVIYMMFAVRQYGRWLRDNYADLEHKEVWQSFLVLAAILLMFGIYVSGFGGKAYEYIVQVCGLFLVCYLLWRVETLQTLEQTTPLPDREGLGESLPLSLDEIGQLLQQHCVSTQLYLQHDLSVADLARAIGTNRSYLSQYFSRQDTTYNAYINNLRIDHFVNLYREATTSQRSFTAQQLASDSGYRSYSTFSLAFKQRMGQTVTAWMRESF
jgi:AraC-like DNA-binding protein